MKKCTSIFFFFILFTCHAFAGSTSLTTYYPTPTAAYNKVSLATNSTPSCLAHPPCPNGTLYVDSTGTLHVWMNGQNTVYPQQCYNSFCSYDNAQDPGDINCHQFLTLPCLPGFTQMSMGGLPNYDLFNTSNNTTVISIVCCSS
jgi:hypothetical protein